MTPKEKAEAARRARNASIAHEVRAGLYMPAEFDREQSFFPPRAIIKKDKREMARVYGGGGGDEGEAS